MNREEARRFLEVIYRNAHGWIEVRGIHADHARPAMRDFGRDVEDALRIIDRMAQSSETNLYVGIATRANANAGGGKANLAEASVLWLDVDFHRSTDVNEFDAALENGLASERPPSLIVNSGGGRHVYWSLEEPWALDTNEGLARFESVLWGIAARFPCGDVRASDATRILRVPGTMNYPSENKRKRGRTAAPCTIDRVSDGEDFWS